MVSLDSPWRELDAKIEPLTESDIGKLLEDYGLEAGIGMQANCNAFLAHIGEDWSVCACVRAMCS